MSGGHSNGDLDRTLAAIRQHGWTCVLLEPQSKKPIGPRWRCTQDPDVIARHVHSGGNIGLVCGPPSGVVVIDPDSPELWQNMLATLGEPGLAWARTGSGRTHVFIAYEPDLPARLLWRGRTVGEIQRGPGQQQVVIPPSVHPNGTRYTWLLDPSQESPSPLPAEWRAYLRACSFNGRGQHADPTILAAALQQPGAVRRLSGIVKFACPACVGEGHDRSKDNAAYFPDSGRWGCAWSKDTAVARTHWEAIGQALGALRAGHDPQGESDDGSRLRVVKWNELTTGEVAAISWHWPGWVGLATVAVLAGSGESLKSWLSLYLACMTAAGRPALAEPGADEPPLAAGPVIYLSAENSLEEDRRRAQLLKTGLDLPEELPVYFVPAESLSLGHDPDYAAVLALVQELRPVALFVDSAIALSGIGSENDNSEVRDFLKRRILPLARQHGVTVYLISHSPKPPMQPGMRFTDEHVARGASDWRNAADTLLYLRRDQTLGELAVVLRHAKNRVGPRHHPIWFQLEEADPGKVVRLVYGGAFSEDTGQGVSAGLKRGLDACIEALKQAPGGIYQHELERQIVGARVTKATYRRALEIIRGKKPWPYGIHRNKNQAIVTEDRLGRHVSLVFDAAQWREDEDWDD